MKRAMGRVCTLLHPNVGSSINRGRLQAPCIFRRFLFPVAQVWSPVTTRNVDEECYQMVTRMMVMMRSVERESGARRAAKSVGANRPRQCLFGTSTGLSNLFGLVRARVSHGAPGLHLRRSVPWAKAPEKCDFYFGAILPVAALETSWAPWNFGLADSVGAVVSTRGITLGTH